MIAVSLEVQGQILVSDLINVIPTSIVGLTYLKLEEYPVRCSGNRFKNFAMHKTYEI
jgi:hypothetical protein